MKLVNSILEKGLIGIGISAIITTFFMFVYAQYYTSGELPQVYSWWLMFGCVAGLSTFIFEKIDNFISATICHFVCVFISFCVAAKMTIPNLSMDIVGGIFIQFIVIYVVIYAVLTYANYMEINASNEKLANKFSEKTN